MNHIDSLPARIVLGTMLGLFAAACPDEDIPPSCTQCDRDGDGIRTPADCNDDDPDVHPGNEEVAGNGKDDDCVGGDAALESCGNGLDDDEDGALDCLDEECAGVELCNGCSGSLLITTGYSGTTAGAKDLVDGCGNGPEHVFSYLPVLATTPALLGFVSISVTGTTPHVASVRSSCSSPDTELECVEYTEIVELVVADDAALSIIVEPVDTPGPYVLTIEYEPLVCGDDREVGPEECDDGNADNGDGCDAECRLEA